MHFGEPFGGLLPNAQGAVLTFMLRTGTPFTGRQVFDNLSDGFSLWSVQKALRSLEQLGLISSQTVGRAHVHAINNDHAAIGPLRQLADPVALLRDAITEAIDATVTAVIIFGSVARGEAEADSDIDLAVVADPDWDGRIELEDSVQRRLGNRCDVLVLSEKDFHSSVTAREPVVSDIVHDGIALIGAIPRTRNRSYDSRGGTARSRKRLSQEG